MDYAENGSLRKRLPEIIKWRSKINLLYKIISGLDVIHKLNLVHHNFHDGNVLKIYDWNSIKISDLGLCQPMESFQSPKKDVIYGVLPFVAPEVLRGKPYTPASDIYSFSMIMWEFTSGVPPFNNKAHNLQLGLSICRGERPEIIENTPQCYLDLMKKCWEMDPLKRPTASEVMNVFRNWRFHCKRIGIINGKFKNDEMEFQKAGPTNNKSIIESHPQSFHTSRLLDFTEQLNNILDREEMKILDYKNEGA